jgi:arylformamidase
MLCDSSLAAFTPPSSPAYCPWPAWKLPDAKPGDPIVYTDPNGVAYTKPQMDSLYDQVCWQQDPPDTGAKDTWSTNQFLAKYGAPERHAYGFNQYEGLDFYKTSISPETAPTMIFIHGGAWRGGSSSSYGYFAENFVNAGANLVVLDFINVIQSGGDLLAMANQVRDGVAWVYQNASTLHIDPNRIYVSGHSSGGHLCGVAITTDWAGRGLPADLIKGAVCASGMYDLAPVAISARNTYVNFTPQTVSDLSPAQHIDNIHTRVVLGHGTKETPEFQRQTELFAAQLRAAGKPVALVVAPGYNHFEFVETFANPYGPMGRASLELMGLSKTTSLAWAVPGTKEAVEYYNSALAEYFLTTDPGEIAKLDTKVVAGWSRTSQSFSAYPDASSGGLPVCRFFSAASTKRSDHLYTADANQCAAAKADPNWQYEGIVFYIGVPDSAGNCKAGTAPIFGLHNGSGAAASSHRYVTNANVRSQMIASGWVPEGSGTLGVVMCAPA